MRFVFGKRFVLAAISLALVLAACGGSSHARSGADAVGKVKDTVPPPKHSTRLAGLPPVGARASLPAHDTLLVELANGSLYADGQIVTDRGVRRLTPRGARLLWSKIRAVGQAAGLFRERTPNLVPARYLVFDCWLPGGPRMDTLFANATSRLPASAWADRTIRPFVPSHYDLTFDQVVPDSAKLPPPAREALARYQPLLRHYGHITITTDQARALIAAFVKAGVKPVRNREEADFRLPVANGAFVGLGTPVHHTILQVSRDGPVPYNCRYRYGGS